MALQVGGQVGDYEILALIGAGGMGRVYKVRNKFSNREEAMKVLLPDLNSERELAARFMVEIRTLASLDHPNIAQLRTAFQVENELVMIMEYVEGVTLEKLAGEAPLPIDRELDYAMQVLSALSYAHSRGVIHRDIKPANIMITSHGQVKLMDFGIAKNADEMQLTRPGMTIGSVYYMSPEQVRGGTVDARSDLYSFGITLYESLTGRKPFEAETSYSVLNAHLMVAPVPPIEVNPALSPELNKIILRALEKNPDDRFQSAQEFHDALKALREPAAAPRPAAVAAPAFVPVTAAAEPISATSAGYAPVAAAPLPQAAPAVAAGAVSGSAPGPAAAPPPFVPVPVAVAKPVAAPAAKSHRGLWIGLGALAAVLALVAVAVVLPHVYATFARQKATAPPTEEATTAASIPAAAPQPSAPTADASQPATPTAVPAGAPGAAASPTTPAKPAGSAQAVGNGGQHRPAYTGAAAQASGAAGAAGAGSVAIPAAPAGPSPQEIRQARDRLSNLEARSDAAEAGVQSIRNEQQKQGLDIRGDVLAAMNRLSNDLREAKSAVAKGDLTAAGEYMERADKETSTLESFLGR